MGSIETSFENVEICSFLQKLAIPELQKKRSEIKKPKVLVIAGPTAVGKTALSLELASVMGGEIISADSMQVYRGMDIGTAKISLEERIKIPHYLIDIREISQSFNVADFYHEATKMINHVLAKKKVPIVVGGTGFYLHALLYGPPQGPPTAPMVRQKLEEEMKEGGLAPLYTRLCEKDPKYAQTVTAGDRHKIIRALEIIEVTQKKVSDFPKIEMHESPYDFRCWFLYRPKEELYPLIEMRCDEMIAHGFIEEVQRLDQRGLRKNTNASQAIGYKQCLDFLEGAKSPEDFEFFVAMFKQASRRYAKRQFTWFRKELLFRWLNICDLSKDHLLEILRKDYELSF